MDLDFQYVEVHNHTYYSPLDGLSSPKEYFVRAKEVGIDKIAITDHGTLTGHREFLRESEGTGITPILGIEAYISETNRWDKRGKAKREDGTNVYNHIILLAKNDQGVVNLNRLSEISWNEGFYNKPRIDFDVLSEYGDGLIVSSGCMSGLISKALEREDQDAADEWARKLKDRFADDFYIELQTHNPRELNKGLLEIADRFDIKAISTGDCHFADPADRVFEEVFLILGTGAARMRIANPNMSHANKLDLMDRLDYLYPERKMSFKEIDVYLERAAIRHEEYKKQGIDRPSLFTNTTGIGDKIEGYTYLEDLETLPVLEDEDPMEKLRALCDKGMKFRNLAHKPEYQARLKEELDIIEEKDNPTYFVVLEDVLAFCRREQIAYGMGRGSGAGSLVNYVNQITEVDPVEENLLFWRFLDLERSDPPDVDIDIQDDRRGEVKRYLAQKYGADHVASISTYTKYKGKSALAAAGMVLNISRKERDFISKNLTDFTGDKDGTRKNLLEFAKAPVFAEIRATYPDLLPVATKLADRLSAYGIHPGGVVIANKPLHTYTGVESRAVPKELIRQNVLCVDGDDAAQIGLIKYDFLGLSNITAVVRACEMIRENHGKIIDWKHMKEDDPKVFEMISEGRTVGVFQANKESSTEVIKKMGIDNFKDLVVSNALVRPGAWKAFGKEFILRKKGRKKITFPTPDSERFLGDTYAFALFQEQSMQICTEIAGMSKSDANKVRKLTAKKKDKEELLPYRSAFIAGAAKKVGMVEAEKLWADIELTAEYSFNKCLADDTMIQVKGYHIPSGIEQIETMTIGDFHNIFHFYTNVYRFYVYGPETIKDGVEKPFNGDSAWHEVKDVHDGGVRDIHRVWFSSDEYIDSSWNHKHLVGRTWKEAGRLFQNDRVHTFDGVRKVWKKTVEPSAQTYDIELFNEPHAFYANGVVTHNSHSVAYSKLSYVTAWLKYYYPAEFLAALLNGEENSKEVSIYMTECKRLGIDVRLPDVNKSDLNYTSKNGVIYMGLQNVKGLGGAKAQHVIANRPYTSYADLLEKVKKKGTGLDTGALGALNAVGATEFHDHPIDWDVVKENLYEFLGIPAFDTGALSDEMLSRITPLDEYDPAEDTIVANAIVTDIVSKGWIRVDLLDSTGTTGLFVNADHGLVKGHKYLMVLANKKIVMHMDMSEFDPDHPIITYLKGAMTPGTWAVAAKMGTTQKGNPVATLVYSNNGVLNSCTAYESQMHQAKSGFVLGQRIRIAVKKSPKFGDIIERVMVYGQ